MAGFLANVPEAVVAMLASASVGAIWSSCSPDFGVRGVLDRFGQIEPKVLFTADGYFYNGKRIDSLGPVAGVVERQAKIDPTVDELLAEGWRMARLDATVRAILRTGAFELFGRDDVPAKVVIDEYVDIANAFFDGPEAGFINAALDKCARKARPGELSGE